MRVLACTTVHWSPSGFKSLLLASGNFRLDSLYVLTSSCVDDQGMFLRAYISGGIIVRTEKVGQSETEDIYTDDLRLLHSASFNSYLTSVRSKRAYLGDPDKIIQAFIQTTKTSHH